MAKPQQVATRLRDKRKPTRPTQRHTTPVNSPTSPPPHQPPRTQRHNPPPLGDGRLLPGGGNPSGNPLPEPTSEIPAWWANYGIPSNAVKISDTMYYNPDTGRYLTPPNTPSGVPGWTLNPTVTDTTGINFGHHTGEGPGIPNPATPVNPEAPQAASPSVNPEVSMLNSQAPQATPAGPDAFKANLMQQILGVMGSKGGQQLGPSVQSNPQVQQILSGANGINPVLHQPVHFSPDAGNRLLPGGGNPSGDVLPGLHPPGIPTPPITPSGAPPPNPNLGGGPFNYGAGSGHIPTSISDIESRFNFPQPSTVIHPPTPSPTPAPPPVGIPGSVNTPTTLSAGVQQMGNRGLPLYGQIRHASGPDMSTVARAMLSRR